MYLYTSNGLLRNYCQRLCHQLKYPYLLKTWNFKVFSAVLLTSSYAVCLSYSYTKIFEPFFREAETRSAAIDSSDKKEKTLFVKNLNFTSTVKDLEDLFTKCVGFRSASLPTKKTNSSKALSMGFGFVEFQSSQDAIKALKKMDGVKLQGHLLQISIAKGSSFAWPYANTIKTLIKIWSTFLQE